MVSFDALADATFERLRGHPEADRVFYAASELGDFSLIWLLLGAVRGLRSDRDLRAALRLAVGAGAESVLVNVVIKSFFRRGRPVPAFERPLRLRVPRTSSFPSGHATSAFSAAALLADGDPLWPVYYVVATVVAASRVHVKIHHASDVVAGAALGTVFGRVMRRVSPLPPVSG